MWLELGEQEGELKIRPARGQGHRGKAVGHGMVSELCSKYNGKALNNFKHKSNMSYTDSQEAHEEMFNIPNYWRNANQNYNEVPVWRFLKKLKIELPYDPEIPLLGIYLEKTIIQKRYMHPMLTAALFTIAMEAT